MSIRTGIEVRTMIWKIWTVTLTRYNETETNEPLFLSNLMSSVDRVPGVGGPCGAGGVHWEGEEFRQQVRENYQRDEKWVRENWTGVGQGMQIDLRILLSHSVSLIR